MRHEVTVRTCGRTKLACAAYIGEKYLHFAHHDFVIEWSNTTNRQEVVRGKNNFFGGLIGEGNVYDSWQDAIQCSLYDLYQMDGGIIDGDTFVVTYLGETVEFRCEGIHVLRV